MCANLDLCIFKEKPVGIVCLPDEKERGRERSRGESLSLRVCWQAYVCVRTIGLSVCTSVCVCGGVDCTVACMFIIVYLYLHVCVIVYTVCAHGERHACMFVCVRHVRLLCSECTFSKCVCFCLTATICVCYMEMGSTWQRCDVRSRVCMCVLEKVQQPNGCWSFTAALFSLSSII